MSHDQDTPRTDHTYKAEVDKLDKDKRKVELEQAKIRLERDRLELEERRRRQNKEVIDLRQAETKLRVSELELVDIERDAANAAAHSDYAHVYNFMGAVDGRTVQQCIGALTRWNRRAEQAGNEYPAIKIIFNSPGGAVIDGLALYDTIEELKGRGHRFTTVARGMAASMGGVLLQAGNERLVGRSAHMLIHEVSSFGIGKVSEMEDELEFCKQLQDRLLEILSDRSTMTKSQIQRKWKKKDWWLNAEDTVKLGFADAIG